jgi:hypothetical protein
MNFKEEIYNDIKQQLSEILTFADVSFTSNIDENLSKTPLIFVDITTFRTRMRDIKIDNMCYNYISTQSKDKYDS